jgi:hypothetical protein
VAACGRLGVWAYGRKERVLRGWRERALRGGFVSSKRMCGGRGISAFLIALEGFGVGSLRFLVGSFCAGVLRVLRGQGVGDRC